MPTHHDPFRWCSPAVVAALSLLAAACSDDQAPTPSEPPAQVPTPQSEPPARIRLTTAVDIALPGGSLDTVVAVVTDASDRPVASAEVTWGVDAGGGSVRAVSSRTDTRGMARAIWTLGPNPGDNVLAASTSSVTARLTAVGSVGFPAAVIAMGGRHACALTRSGEAYCWGSKLMLGIGATQSLPQTTPVRVSGGLTFTSLVAGAWHTCGLTTSGEAYCWGAGPAAQIGSAQSGSTPTRVTGDHRFSKLASGAYHTCGLTTSGAILCWGDDTFGQLGDGRDRSVAVPYNSIGRSTPEPILGNLRFVALSATVFATCAIATTGQTYCWGSNAVREVGTEAGTCRMLADPYYEDEDWDWPCSTKPVPIDSRAALTSITGSGSGWALCGLTADGALLCWGNRHLPAVVPGARLTKAWSLGYGVCGLELGGAVSCWAPFSGGGPVPPPFGDALVLVDLTSSSASCGLTRDEPAVAYCWGINVDGQLGDGTITYRYNPVAVELPRIAR